MEPQGSFGPRLRQERERRQISLTSIAANTKINQSLLEALERDDVSRWPSGIFRRAFVRSYAVAIGMNADELWKEFSERFPDSHTADDAAPAARPVIEQRPKRDLSVEVRRTGSDVSVEAHRGKADRVELVLRVSVPRSWVTRLSRLLSRVAPTPRRQNT